MHNIAQGRVVKNPDNVSAVNVDSRCFTRKLFVFRHHEVRVKADSSRVILLCHFHFHSSTSMPLGNGQYLIQNKPDIFIDNLLRTYDYPTRRFQFSADSIDLRKYCVLDLRNTASCLVAEDELKIRSLQMMLRSLQMALRSLQTGFRSLQKTLRSLQIYSPILATAMFSTPQPRSPLVKP
jgi:hypothetical protein